MLESGVTHVGVATDHVIESFRNDLWPGYKTSEGMDPQLLQQFPLLEESLEALGVVVWPMVELEADDALGTAARAAGASPEVGRVFICTPDKDLAQCVQGTRTVQLDRRLRREIDEEGVRAKFGVSPASIPDYLALIGDSADGFPGLPGWGAKSAAAVLARYGHITDIPVDDRPWGGDLRGTRFEKLKAVLRDNLDLALLFRDIATLRTEAPIAASPVSLHWVGPTDAFSSICERLGAPQLLERARRASERRAGASHEPVAQPGSSGNP
jgi:5'-3' exonuclease